MKKQVCLGVLVLGVTVIGGLCAVPPAWWAQRGATNSNSPDYYAVANIGQLKHFASKGISELEENLPGGAGSSLLELLQRWQTPPELLDPPGSPRDDYAVLKLGQLKFVANLFYVRLQQAGYTTGFPWTDPAQPADNEALANLGQLKYVFNFDLTKDTDNDGTPDWFNSTVANSSFLDSDGDGLMNDYEASHGNNPLVQDNPAVGLQVFGYTAP